jgi:hypothetical protein
MLSLLRNFEYSIEQTDKSNVRNFNNPLTCKQPKRDQIILYFEEAKYSGQHRPVEGTAARTLSKSSHNKKNIQV